MPAGRPATASSTAPKREIEKRDDPNCPHCANHELITHKKTRAQIEREADKDAEQRRLMAIKEAEKAEADRKKAEREANSREMNLTLRDIENKRRADWEAKKNDRTNLEQTKKLQKEAEALKMKQNEDIIMGKQTYKNELNKEREAAIALNVQGKISDRELEQRLNGLQFE